MVSVRPAQTRFKRRVFTAALAVLLYLFAEFLVLVLFALYSLDPFWIAATQAQRDAVRAELEARRDLVVQVHPYVGYVEEPPKTMGGDSAGNLRTYDVSAYGYVDRVAPIQARAAGKVIVAIVGGSVAWSFHLHGTERLRALLASDPALAGKELVFVNLAISGYKQPQQLMTLNYMLVLGAQFDVVINIDGFNEAALYEAENASHHVFPAFPRSWHTRVEVAGRHMNRYLGRLEYQVDRRLDLTRGFSRRPWRYSPLANLAWWLLDCQSEIRIRALQLEYRESVMTARDPVVEGPGWTFATRQDLYRHLVALWKNGSAQLDKLCAGNGIRYYHFLQPNLFVTGSKPLTAAEQRMASDRDLIYRPGVRDAYPLMIAEGRDLKAHGERFTDLTQMFSDHPGEVFVDICHLNQAGNDFLADKIAEGMRDEPQKHKEHKEEKPQNR